MAEKVVCACGHERRQHSILGCGECSCPLTYMDLSPRKFLDRVVLVLAAIAVPTFVMWGLWLLGALNIPIG